MYDSSAGVVEYLRIDYDVEAGREALRRLQLPDRCLHAPPRAHRRLLRLGARVVARHRAAGGDPRHGGRADR